MGEHRECPSADLGLPRAERGKPFTHELGTEWIRGARPYAELALVGDSGFGQPCGVVGEASELDGLERVDARRVALAGTVMDGCDLRQDL